MVFNFAQVRILSNIIHFFLQITIKLDKNNYFITQKIDNCHKII